MNTKIDTFFISYYEFSQDYILIRPINKLSLEHNWRIIDKGIVAWQSIDQQKYPTKQIEEWVAKIIKLKAFA